MSAERAAVGEVVVVVVVVGGVASAVVALLGVGQVHELEEALGEGALVLLLLLLLLLRLLRLFLVPRVTSPRVRS